MVQQRKKPAKLMWTQSWRRLNKKGKDEGIAKKRSRKAVRVTRAIVGASVEDVRISSRPFSKLWLIYRYVEIDYFRWLEIYIDLGTS